MPSQTNLFPQLLPVLFQPSDGLLDLTTIHFSEVNRLLNAVGESSDCCRSAVFAFSHCDTGRTFPDVFVVGGDVLPLSFWALPEGVRVTAGLAEDES